MKTLIVFALLLAVGIATAESKFILNAKRLSTGEIGITCANGGDPTGQKIGDVLIISCGK